VAANRWIILAANPRYIYVRELTAPANPPDWIARLNPQVALLSVATGDRDGRPDERTLQAVQDYALLKTDKNGWIELSNDGKQMWVEVERK
jgi:beta-lactamase superfamily II metal-dependent hydrolase